MSNSPGKTCRKLNEEQMQPRNASQESVSSDEQSCIHSKVGLQQRPCIGLGSNAKDGAIPKFGSWGVDDCSRSASHTWIPEELSGPREDSGRNQLYNFGRVPLNWDFVADRAQRLPSNNEDAYGGGFRPMYEQTVGNAWNASYGNGASTPTTQMHVQPKGVTSKRKPSFPWLVFQKIGCFRWFC